MMHGKKRKENMKKGAKKDYEKGKLTGIITRKDFDKMDKDMNFQHKEICLTLANYKPR